VSRLKIQPIRKFDSTLRRLGVEKVSQNASHVKYVRGTKQTIIPDHGSKDIGRGLMCDILRQLGITIDEYNRAAGVTK
jgi:predicted RNA binding protein YcfA (HicA-like mRNA interferase family)